MIAKQMKKFLKTPPAGSLHEFFAGGGVFVKANIKCPSTTEDYSMAHYYANIAASLNKKWGIKKDGPQPEVAIFWFNPPKKGKELFFRGISYPWDEGPLFKPGSGLGGAYRIVYEGPHLMVWDEVIKQVPEWSKFQWDEVPRGRVSLVVKTTRFEVSLPVASVNDSRLRQTILDQYNLKSEFVDWVGDSYY